MEISGFFFMVVDPDHIPESRCSGQSHTRVRESVFPPGHNLNLILFILAINKVKVISGSNCKCFIFYG